MTLGLSVAVYLLYNNGNLTKRPRDDGASIVRSNVYHTVATPTSCHACKRTRQLPSGPSIELFLTELYVQNQKK